MMALRAWPVAEALALVAGTAQPAPGLRWHEEYPMEETLGAVSLLMAAHQLGGPATTAQASTAAQLWTGFTPEHAGTAVPRWWIHQIVQDGLVVGDIGFHGPPSPEHPVTVEIGYNVVAALRGRGVASEACALLLQQAWRHGAEVVLADTDPGNVASQRVLLRCGFEHRGEFCYLARRSTIDGGLSDSGPAARASRIGWLA